MVGINNKAQAYSRIALEDLLAYKDFGPIRLHPTGSGFRDLT